jgi:hypothetical protein
MFTPLSLLFCHTTNQAKCHHYDSTMEVIATSVESARHNRMSRGIVENTPPKG